MYWLVGGRVVSRKIRVKRGILKVGESGLGGMGLVVRLLLSCSE